MYYKIHVKTVAAFGSQALQPILRKNNVVKRHTTLIYEATIKTKKDHLVDEIVATFESKGIKPSEYKITSTPYERKAPKKHKSKRTP